MKHYESEINLFIDNELSPERQKELFYHLSGCDECRNLLSDFIQLKNETKDFYNRLGYAVYDMRSFPDTTSDNKSKQKYSIYIAAVAVVILGILFLFQLNDRVNSDKKYSEIYNNFISLKKDYDLLSKIDNAEIIKSTEKEFAFDKPKDEKKDVVMIDEKKRDKVLGIKHRDSDYLKYVNSLPTEEITKNDFLTPQIIGN